MMENKASKLISKPQQKSAVDGESKLVNETTSFIRCFALLLLEGKAEVPANARSVHIAVRAGHYGFFSTRNS